MKRMEEFVRRHRLDIGLEEMGGLVEEFAAEMRKGLREECSLQMLPTYIGLDDGLDFSRDVIVVDAGGTNLRIALVHFGDSNVPEISYFQKYPMLGKDREISVEEFFLGLADCLEPVAHSTDYIGMCFSFPADVLPNRDAKIRFFNKEVRVAGASGAIIGERLNEALRAKGLPGNKSVVVINDTVASLLGAKADNTTNKAWSSYIGLILGTGLNTAYIEENSNIQKSSQLRERSGGSIINVESGGYDRLPQSSVDAAFIAATEEPKRQYMEKMSSGAYQGGLLLAYLRAAEKEGCFSTVLGEKLRGITDLSGIAIDQFCDYPYGDNLLASLCAGEEDVQAVYQLTDAFFHRVALITAVNLAGILTCLGSKATNPCRPVCISAEGTTFYKARLLRPKLDYIMTAFVQSKLGLHSRFVKVENATITGTAIAGILGN